MLEIVVALIFGATGVALIAWWAAERVAIRHRDASPGDSRAPFENGGIGLSPETVTRHITGR